MYLPYLAAPLEACLGYRHFWALAPLLSGPTGGAYREKVEIGWNRLDQLSWGAADRHARRGLRAAAYLRDLAETTRR